MLRIGIDVGGTNTDAVIMDGRHVRSAIKTSTTVDVTAGERMTSNLLDDPEK